MLANALTEIVQDHICTVLKTEGIFTTEKPLKNLWQGLENKSEGKKKKIIKK